MKTFSGNSLSKFGFGSKKLFTREALLRGIEGGINVIDTSAHFDSGRTEIEIGKWIETFRKDVFVTSKVGYVTGNSHSMSVDFIKKQVENSAKNLGYVDCYLLNNPERIGLTGDALYEKIAIALDCLDSYVQKGVIRSFGIASNSITINTRPDYFSLEQILKSTTKNFSVVQFPLNIFERNALESYGSPSLLDIIEENGLYSMTQRPLICITKNGVRKLKCSEIIESDLLISSFEKSIDLELELQGLLGSNEQDLSLISKFSWSHVINENINRLLTNPLATQVYFDRDVLPALKNDLEQAKSIHREELESWLTRYEIAIKSLMNQVVKIAQSKESLDNQDLNNILSTCKGLDFDCADNALIAASSMHSGTVLVGMHSLEYVDKVLAIKDKRCDLDTLDHVLNSPYFE